MVNPKRIIPFSRQCLFLFDIHVQYQTKILWDLRSKSLKRNNRIGRISQLGDAGEAGAALVVHLEVVAWEEAVVCLEEILVTGNVDRMSVLRYIN